MRKFMVILFLCSVASAQNPYRTINRFNAGELSPLLSAREDLAKYQSGCSIMENLIPIPQGGAQKRPGTKYIAEVKTSSLATRIIPFEFSTTQSYIIELGNQYMRFYTNSARISTSAGSEDLSALSNRIAHWKLNDNAPDTTVVDAEGNHNGESTENTSTLHVTGKIGDGCFDFNGQYAVEINDHINFTFDDSGAGGTFSIAAWIYIEATDSFQFILSKRDDAGSASEWSFHLESGNKLRFLVFDKDNAVNCYRTSNVAPATGWRFVVGTYDSTGGGSAANGIKLYIDGSLVASTATNNGAYVQMRDQTTKVVIGGRYISGVLSNYFVNRIDNVAIFSDVLDASEISDLYTSSAIYEITTPYLTADLFELKYEQSADVLYVTHPDYETKKISRLGNADWAIASFRTNTGPFRTQNTNSAATISADGTTDSVILTAVNCSPFVSGTTAGHLSSGTTAISKSQMGALFKLIHPIGQPDYTDTFAAVNDYVDCGTLFLDAGWSLTTSNTWRGTVKVQRNYTIGAAWNASGWETVATFLSGTGDGVGTQKNFTTSGTEDYADADYQVIYTVDWGGTVEVLFDTDQTDYIGIVEITAVATTTSATGTVIKTLASTNATHKWSEGSWSNYRGWPQTVTFYEDRLTFGGNTSQPDTIWASVSSDYDNMTAGVNDDDALIFTLSSRRVNVIEWIIGKDKLLIGTSGAEWTITGGTDEPVTPSNVLAKQHSTYGSANLQATLANESVLFFQRGAEKMRELAYNWESDSYVAPDMTILASFVADGGIVDTSFQKTPDSILWCVRNDGELPVFSYERAENVTAWSRMVTADSTGDSDFESVAVISGSPEDEVWVVVKRTMSGVNSGNPVRYIEQFQPRDFGSSASDAFYVDSGVTYSGGTTTATGLGHLIGETMIVLGDGTVQTEAVTNDFVVTVGGEITLPDTFTTAQIGLAYEVHLRTMPLSWVAEGMTIQGRMKRISEVIASWYKSGDFQVGRDTSTLETISITGQTTAQDRVTFPPGYDRDGYVYVYQKSPEPLTLLAVMIEFSVP